MFPSQNDYNLQFQTNNRRFLFNYYKCLSMTGSFKARISWILINIFFLSFRGGKSYVTDATAAIVIAFSMFLFPSVRPELFGGPRRAGTKLK